MDLTEITLAVVLMDLERADVAISKLNSKTCFKANSNNGKNHKTSDISLRKCLQAKCSKKKHTVIAPRNTISVLPVKF